MSASLTVGTPSLTLTEVFISEVVFGFARDDLWFCCPISCSEALHIRRKTYASVFGGLTNCENYTIFRMRRTLVPQAAVRIDQFIVICYWLGLATFCVFFSTCHAVKYASSVDGVHSLAYLFLATCRWKHYFICIF